MTRTMPAAKLIHSSLVLKVVLLLLSSAFAGHVTGAGSLSNTLRSEPTPYIGDEELPERTPPIIELGADFLGTGNLHPGFRLPTGAIWQPSLWVYGSLRSSLQHYDSGGGAPAVNELANRLDLFANLQLTGTERIVLGLTPLHDDAVFSGFTSQGNGRRTVNGFNADTEVLFFEGDLAELFPNWDADDSSPNDIGFSVGRQTIVFQDGFLINDILDGVGFSKNNVVMPGVGWLTNWRSSVFYAWDNVHRFDMEDESAKLYAWFNQLDTVRRTINIDFAYVSSDDFGDLYGYAIDSTQRFGLINTTFRVAGSITDEASSLADDGTLLFSEVSWTPAHTHNIAYVNAFIGIGNFTPIANGPTQGGPLGRTGILFAARGIGSFPPALSTSVKESYGIATGYQLFFGEQYRARRQVILEVGTRATDDDLGREEKQFAVGFRFQQALGRRFVWQLDGFVADSNTLGILSGFRTELLVKF